MAHPFVKQQTDKLNVTFMLFIDVAFYKSEAMGWAKVFKDRFSDRLSHNLTRTDSSLFASNDCSETSDKPLLEIWNLHGALHLSE